MFSKNLIWTPTIYNNYLNYLKKQKDTDDFKKFSQRLITTKDQMLGIKIPKLRKLAKEISKTEFTSFLDHVTNTYYEEKLVEGFVIGNINNKNIFDQYFFNFIRKIDNWSTCDTVISSCKIMKRDHSYYQEACKLIEKKDEFIVRVGLIIILDHYIDDVHIDDILNKIDKLKSNYYYVNMAIAWLISTCFVKYRDKTLEYLKHNNLNKFTYNKAIQKTIESLRVSLEDKNMLRQMKKK